ncbi:MAG: energy transducer TonB [Luteibacter sp.]
MAAAPAAHAQGPATINGEPWPIQGGKLVSGSTLVRIRVAWDGTPVMGCIERSSGNAVLDRAALVNASTQHVPPMSTAGVPRPFYGRMPFNFDPKAPASDTVALPQGPKQACDDAELPAYAPAMRRRQLEAAHTIDIALGNDGLVPGTTAPWPRDEAGRPVSGEVFVNTEVKGGRIDRSMTLVDPQRAAAMNPVFVVAAARATNDMALDDPSDPVHGVQLILRFTVPATLDVSRLPVYAENSPQGKEGTRLKACEVVADFAYIMSRDHRAGVSQADALAKVKKVSNGLFPQMLETIAGIVYKVPPLYGNDMDDDFHRTRSLLYCIAVLGPPSG